MARCTGAISNERHVAGDRKETPVSTTRFVDVDGCFNLRDLGGYRSTDGRSVGWRRLYRSDGLYRLTTAGWASFQSLGVATVLDLRTPGEVRQRPWTPPVTWSGRWLHLPLLQNSPDWSTLTGPELAADDFAANHYMQITVEGAVALRTAVEVLAEPGGLPAVFHCAAGKDRTGVLAALVLRLLGVPVDVVGDDYALSEDATTRWEASLKAGNQDETQTAWAYVPPAMMVAAQSSMLTFLRRIDVEHGSIEGFAAQLGILDATIGRLREALLT
jgi:protein-tyrosine phosphatase